MSKINEYPQAVTINNNDLFVIDQESGGDHATKSASVSQIADKATSGVQSQIGDLSTLTTTEKSSLVGAVNEVNGKIKSYNYSGNTNSNGNLSITSSAPLTRNSIIIGAICTSDSIYVAVGKNSSGNPMLMFRDINSNSGIASTAVSGTVLYIDP